MDRSLVYMHERHARLAVAAADQRHRQLLDGHDWEREHDGAMFRRCTRCGAEQARVRDDPQDWPQETWAPGWGDCPGGADRRGG